MDDAFPTILPTASPTIPSSTLTSEWSMAVGLCVLIAGRIPSTISISVRYWTHSSYKALSKMIFSRWIRYRLLSSNLTVDLSWTLRYTFRCTFFIHYYHLLCHSFILLGVGTTARRGRDGTPLRTTQPSYRHVRTYITLSTWSLYAPPRTVTHSSIVYWARACLTITATLRVACPTRDSAAL